MKDYHVTGTWGTPRERESFVCGVAALSKADAASAVIDRLNGDAGMDMGVRVSTVVAIPGRSTLGFMRPILYSSR